MVLLTPWRTGGNVSGISSGTMDLLPEPPQPASASGPSKPELPQLSTVVTPRTLTRTNAVNTGSATARSAALTARKSTARSETTKTNGKDKKSNNPCKSLPIKDFSKQFYDDTQTAVPVDIFGKILGPVLGPDEKEDPIRINSARAWGKKETGRVMGDRSDSMWLESGFLTERSNRKEATVVLHPEFTKFTSRRAKSLTLEFTPGLVDNFMKTDASNMETPRAWPDKPRYLGPFLNDQDATELVQVEVPKKGNLQAVASGYLPPDTARHDQRNKPDKVYTVRQHYELRNPLWKRLKNSDAGSGSTDHEHSTGGRNANEGLEPQAPEAPPVQAKDFSGGPHYPDPRKCSAATIRRMVKDKLRWGRFEVVDGKYAERSRPAKLFVPEVEKPPVDTSISKANKKLFTHDERREQIKQRGQQFEEKHKKVAEKRKTVVEEYKQWQMQVLSRADASKHAADCKHIIAEQEMKQRQTLWMEILGHVITTNAMMNIVGRTRDSLRAQRLQDRAALRIQSFIRSKILARAARSLQKSRMALKERIKPLMYFWIKNWKAKRLQRKTDIIRETLVEFMKTNSVKRGISNFLYNMRKLQFAWRNRMKRQRARLQVLSRQWDKAFTLIRTKGKYGKLGVTLQGITADKMSPGPPPAKTEPRSTRSRDRGRRAATFTALSGGSISSVEARLNAHNVLYVNLNKKQIGVLNKLSGTNFKQRILKAELRRLQIEFQERVRENFVKMAEYQTFMEQKIVVESVLVGFAKDEESGHELTEKLLGGKTRMTYPVYPRYHPVLPPKIMQEHIVQGLGELMLEFNRKFFDGSEETEPDPQENPPSKINTSGGPHDRVVKPALI